MPKTNTTTGKEQRFEDVPLDFSLHVDAEDDHDHPDTEDCEYLGLGLWACGVCDGY